MMGRVLSWIGLALATLAIAGWCFSYIRPAPAILVHTRADRAIFLTSSAGSLMLWAQEIAPPPPPAVSVQIAQPFHFRVATVEPQGGGYSINTNSFTLPRPTSDLGWEVMRQGSGVVMAGRTPYAFSLSVRAWLISWRCLLAIALIAPAMRFLWWYMRRRLVLAGRCGVCGYDLRATPDPGGKLMERCPECGALTQPASAMPPPAMAASTIPTPPADQTPFESDDARPPST